MRATQQNYADITPSPGDASTIAHHAFEKTLAAIRQRGIERGIDAPSPGISSLSVPILDIDQTLCAALTVVGPSGALDVRWNGPAARALREAASAVCRELAAAS